MRTWIGACILAVALTGAGAASAAELRVLSSNGTSAIVRAIGAEFARRTGHAVVTKIDVAVLLQKDIEAGETFDVAILTRAVIDELTQKGAIDAATRTDVARSGIGVAMRTGAKKPDIGMVDAFRRTFLDAGSVAYTTVGGSGIHFVKMLERLGIADAVRAKAKTQPGGTVGELVARGEAELAVQQVSELLPVEGIELVGPFPPELQLITLFSAGMSPHAKNPDAAKALLRFFAEPVAREVIKAKGMDPPP
jgi:molybdate transport system substrate-binding protein